MFKIKMEIFNFFKEDEHGNDIESGRVLSITVKTAKKIRIFDIPWFKK